MSFILPGNARSLRFTGELKAYASPDARGAGGPPKPGGSMALGQPRARKPSAPPAPRRVPNPSQATTPSPGMVPPLVVPTPAPASVVSVSASPARPPAHSMSDDPTRAMDRDDVLPGALRPPKPTFQPHAPAIPHFRPRSIQPPAASASPPPMPDTASRKMRTAGAPYAVWIVASIIAGVVSYHLAPEILVRREPPAHVTGDH